MLDNQQQNMVNVYNHIFYFRNDAAHKIDHAETVFKTMLSINSKLGYNIDNKSIFLAAYIHDAFVGIDRNNHATLGSEYIKNIGDDYIAMLSEVERSSVAFAIEHHRASNDDIYDNHKLTTILRIADKGEPILKEKIKRSLQYTISRDGIQDLNRICENVAFHMTDKYGRNGYAWNKDDPYIKYYIQKIDAFWDRIDKLTVKDVMNVYTSSF